MSFGVASSAGEGGRNGSGSAAEAAKSGKSKDLAARQQKGAAQTNARKRRMLGVRCFFSFFVFVEMVGRALFCAIEIADYP